MIEGIKYGQSLRIGSWLGGDSATYGVNGCETAEDAADIIVRMAIAAGAKPPPRWRFWEYRWPERLEKEYRKQMGE